MCECRRAAGYDMPQEYPRSPPRCGSRNPWCRHRTSSMPLEELNRPLVLLCSFTTFKSAEIPSPAGLWIFLAGIKPKLTGCKFANHKHSNWVPSLYYRVSGEPKPAGGLHSREAASRDQVQSMSPGPVIRGAVWRSEVSPFGS